MFDLEMVNLIGSVDVGGRVLARENLYADHAKERQGNRSTDVN